MFKKVLSIVAISTLGLGVALAQHGAQQFENKSPDEVAKMKTERMTQRLDLTSDQSAKVHTILLESATHRVEIQEKYPQMKEAKAEMKEFRTETKASVQKVLTSEQQDKAKEMRAGHMKMKKGPKNDGFSVEQKIQRMKTNLDLTDSQVKELTQIFEEKQAQKEEIKAKYPELAEAKKEMKQNREETKKQLETVLTVEQYKMLSERGPKNCKGSKKGK